MFTRLQVISLYEIFEITQFRQNELCEEDRMQKQETSGKARNCLSWYYDLHSMSLNNIIILGVLKALGGTGIV